MRLDPFRTQCRNAWARPPLLLPGAEKDSQVLLDLPASCWLLLLPPGPRDVSGAGGCFAFSIPSYLCPKKKPGLAE